MRKWRPSTVSVPVTLRNFGTAAVSSIDYAIDTRSRKREEKHLDLVVMGSHGYTNFRSAVMGSVATHVAAQGNVPLLIVRSPEHQPQEFGEE